MAPLAKMLTGSVFVWSLGLLDPSSVVLADENSLAGAATSEQVTAVRAQPGPTHAIALANLPGPNGGVEWGRAEGVIEAHPDDVLAILHDYAQYAGLFPHFEKSRVLSQRGTDAIVYLEAKVLHGAATLWGQVRMNSTQARADDGATTHVVEAKMMKGKSNIAQFLARWEIQELDHGQRTRVAFQLLVDPDLPVPDVVVSSEMKNSAGRAFRALQKRASQRAIYAARPNNAM